MFVLEYIEDYWSNTECTSGEEKMSALRNVSCEDKVFAIHELLSV